MERKAARAATRVCLAVIISIRGVHCPLQGTKASRASTPQSDIGQGQQLHQRLLSGLYARRNVEFGLVLALSLAEDVLPQWGRSSTGLCLSVGAPGSIKNPEGVVWGASHGMERTGPATGLS